MIICLEQVGEFRGKSCPSETECQNPDPGRNATPLDRPRTICSLGLNSLSPCPVVQSLKPFEILTYVQLILFGKAFAD